MWVALAAQLPISTTALAQTGGLEFDPIASFGNGDPSLVPAFGVTLAPDGTLYGVAQNTSLRSSVRPDGVVYAIRPGTTFPVTLAVLTSPFGARPQGPLVRAADGTLYGTTYQGGAKEWGTVFAVRQDGTLTTLHDFGANLPENPDIAPRHPSALVLGSDGALYGTTRQGGTHYGGTIFRITTQGEHHTLHEFSDVTVDPASPDGGAGGWTPAAHLALGRDGRLYGTADGGGASRWGTAFRIDLGGQFERLADFTNLQARPGPLLQASDGKLYGMSGQGGDAGLGAVFSVDPVGRSVTNIVSGCFYGDSPAALVQGAGGLLYGTQAGGACGNALFRLSLAGSYETLFGVVSTGPLNEITGGVFLGTGVDPHGEGFIFRMVDGSGCPLPVITEPPRGSSVAAGQPALLSLTAVSELPLSIQWYSGSSPATGAPIAFATSSTYQTGPLFTTASFSARVRNACGWADSAGATIAVTPPTTLTSIRGQVYFRGGWLLDGPWIRKVEVSLYPLDASAASAPPVIASQGNFEFVGVSPGKYGVSAHITYDALIGAQTTACSPFTPNPGGFAKGVATVAYRPESAAIIVEEGRTATTSIEVPSPMVFIHGIQSDATRWASWANVANANGHMTLPVNYNDMIVGGDWQAPAAHVETQIIQNLRGWTTGAATNRYPRWALVAHSQGGLIARVLASTGGVTPEGAGLLPAVHQVHLLGTPNQGAVKNTAQLDEYLGCYGYLTAKRMESDFRPRFPNFGADPQKVFAVAGTNHCFGAAICKPGKNDSIVPVDSVFCQGGSCQIDKVNRRTAHYWHQDLGTEDSLDILRTFILPSLR